jgi:cytochrome c nitrite reductase small subunit
MKTSTLAIALACALGAPAGIGAFTFVYAKGFGYLSRDPRMCLNCHVMSEQYASWGRSGHRHAAVCVDCHLPPAGLAKWIAKADNGFRHSVAFTLQNFHEPIAIKPHDRDIARENCARCHADLVHAITAIPARAGPGIDCLHCHEDAGH